MNVHKVGAVDDGGAKVIRIVHISDTHMRHEEYLPLLPEGDILVHSGDFSAFSSRRYFGNKTRDRQKVCEDVNNFFSNAKFKHKIFVAGNHELSYTENDKEYVENALDSVVYLQDKGTTIEGISIYGSPWTSKRWTSYARGFVKPVGQLGKYWDRIPMDTDILVTHLPPEGVMDLAVKKFNCCCRSGTCEVCGDRHPGFEHWGCPELRHTVISRVRPMLHLFGHVHESTGVRTIDGVTFSNAAMKIKKTINVFDYYLKS